MTAKNPNERVRLFVAIPVPEPVRMEMIRVQHELEPLAPRGAVRWSRSDQFHLTLKFLGGVMIERLAALQESVQTVCSACPVLALRAQGVGFFPNARSPRVIWAGVHDRNGQLEKLQKKIEDAVRPFSDEPGGTNFAGHLTLGRFKKFIRHEIEPLTARAQEMNDRLFGQWMAEAIEFIRSDLSPAGARHTLLARFCLAQ
jgi:RNA 2',3'-cyclic 3'-phosphodiesterase